MIKNKTLDIENIFKTYLKLLKNSLKTFYVSKQSFIKHHKTIFKNYFSELFSKTITKQTLNFYKKLL